MSSGLYDLITVAAPSVQNTCERSAPTCTTGKQVSASPNRTIYRVVRHCHALPDSSVDKLAERTCQQHGAALAFRAEKEAKKGAPVYSLQPPIVPIMPACPFDFSAACPALIVD